MRVKCLAQELNTMPPPELDGVYLTAYLFQREPVVSTSWLSALEADSSWSSHPISVKVQRPEEIDDIFDTISYQKVRKPLVHTFNAMRGTRVVEFSF